MVVPFFCSSARTSNLVPWSSLFFRLTQAWTGLSAPISVCPRVKVGVHSAHWAIHAHMRSPSAREPRGSEAIAQYRLGLGRSAPEAAVSPWIRMGALFVAALRFRHRPATKPSLGPLPPPAPAMSARYCPSIVDEAGRAEKYWTLPGRNR